MKLKQLLYETGILDKYAFADNPKIRKNFYNSDYESNNEFEKKLYDAFRSWVNRSNDIVLYNLIKDSRNKLISDYPEIFKPKTPNGTILYRGISIVSDDIIFDIQNTTAQDWEKSKIVNDGYKYKKPIKYTPRKLLQSWTSESSVAKRFMSYVVLETPQNSEFFMNADALYYMQNRKKEYECIHFDKEYSEPIFLHIRTLILNTKYFENNTKELMNFLKIEKYKINEDGSVDVDGDVDLSYMHLTKIPGKFGNVTGDFFCNNNQLTSLENSPKSVAGDFICSSNSNLTSLAGAPQKVNGDFNCSFNPSLESLAGAPQKVNGDFNCSFNPSLKSLDYRPKHIGGKVYSDFE